MIVDLPVPDTLEAALDPIYLTRLLAPMAGGRRVVNVKRTEDIIVMASKARISVTFEGDDGDPVDLCVKALFGFDSDPTTVREARFYAEIAPAISMRVPGFAAAAVDDEHNRGLLVMRDLLAAGGHFCGALEPMTANDAAETLDQIARLHAEAPRVDHIDWLPNRAADLARDHMLSVEEVQSHLDDPRGDSLAPHVRDAGNLYAAMARIPRALSGARQCVLHGDCHAGNVYRLDGKLGFADWQLVQSGAWPLDIAYHICAVLPVDLAEKEEWRLLDHYRDRLAHHGGGRLDRDEARQVYRLAQPYGFYHWAITRRADPRVVREFSKRLGAGIARHDSYALLEKAA